MKSRLFWTVVFLMSILSCKKSGSGSLSIKIASLSSTTIPVNSSLQVILDFTDNGGNPIDTVYMKKYRINKDSLAPDNVKIDEFYFTPPSYPGKTKGQLQIDLDYENFLKYAISPPQIDSTHFESDSLIIKFVAKDNANNVSDTVSTGLIVVERVQ